MALMGRRAPWLALLSLLASCAGSPALSRDAGPDSSPDGSVAQCAQGLRSYGPACIPVFDECKDDEVPLLGGGCKRVGVEECTAAGGGPGLKAPPDWSCTPIGPPTTCLSGWAQTKDNWCEPILPAAPCAPGTMEVIGKSDCQPIGDCGSGTYGKIATTAATLYVDGSYAGGDGDGSLAKPFATIGAALAAAKSGVQIAVAAGDYKEDLTVKTPVVLEGRCAQLVRIVGQGSVQGQALVIGVGPTAVRGVSITGPAGCVRVDAIATLERVAVAGCGSSALRVAAGGTLAVADSTVVSAGRFGVWAAGGTAKLQRSVVRDTRTDAVNGGAGILVSSKDGPAQLEMTDSLVAGNAAYGIAIWGATVSATRSVVKDSQPDADKSLGIGILCSSLAATPGQLSLTDSLVAGNRRAGVRVDGSAAIVERTVVRDTDAEALDGGRGFGIVAQTSDPPDVLPSSLTLRDSIVARNRAVGTYVIDSTLTVERSVVRDTRPQASDGGFGTGVEVDQYTRPAAATVRDSLVAGNRNSGVFAVGASLTVERSVVRDTAPEQASGQYGGGIGINTQLAPGQPTLVVRDCLIAKNAMDGVEAQAGVEATVERTRVLDTGMRDDMHPLALSFGLNAQPGSTLSASECIVAGGRWLGVFFAAAKGTLSNTVVRDTQPHATGLLGLGVALTGGSSVTVTGCAIDRNRGVGIGVKDSTATVEATAVRSTLPGIDLDHKEGYGDGISGMGASASVKVTAILVEASTRAGLLFSAAGGSVRQCVVRKGVFAIDLEEGAVPIVGDDNLYDGNVEDRVSWGNGLTPLAPPVLPPAP
jgi:hypothetical protein